MANSRERRLAKELQDIQADKDKSGISVVPVEGSLAKLKGSFPGPPDTVYEGGTYQIDIQIPENYPFKAPHMQFDTRVWHPNVSSQTGMICLDTLKNNWSPVQTIKTALMSVRLLLECPNPSDPQDGQVASQMKQNPVAFATHAQEWAIKYAGAPRRQLDLSAYEKEAATQAANAGNSQRYEGFHPALVDEFVSMGFGIDIVLDTFVHFQIPKDTGHAIVPAPELKQMMANRILQQSLDQ